MHSVGYGATKILVIGGVHGDELPSVPLTTRFFEYFKKENTLHEQLTVHFILEANPDGGFAKTRTNAAGVDINRNMEDEWSAESKGPRTYPGPSPYSEPETVALRNVIESIKPDRILSIHAYANIIDYDTVCGLHLANLMSSQNQMKVATIGYPTPGSLGRYCTKRKIPLVTLELPRGRTDEDIWVWQRPALLTFLRGSIDR
jgi:murein peptide amidase A